MLRNLGDLTADECGERVAGGLLGRLDAGEARSPSAAPRASAIAGEERYIAAEDAGALPRRARRAAAARAARDASSRTTPDAMARPGAPLRANPRAVPDRAARRAATASIRRRRLRELERAGDAGPGRAAARAAPSASGATPTCCAGSGAPASPTCAARSSRPTPRARPLPAELAERRRPPRRRGRAGPPARGAGAAPGRHPDARRSGSRTCCRGASAPTRPAWLDELCTSGEVVWVGAGALGRSDGRVALYFREDVRLAGPPPANAKLEPPEGEAHDAIRERLGRRPVLLARPASPSSTHAGGGAARRALGPRLGRGGDQRRLRAAAGAAAAAPSPSQERGGRRFARRRGGAGPAVQGRWSLTAPLFEDAPSAGPRLRAQAELMLERYGIVTRETVLAEGVPGGFATLYAELVATSSCWAPPAAATSSRGSAAPSSPSPARSSACARCPNRRRLLPRARRHRSGQPLRRRRCPGRSRASGRRPARTAGAHVLLRDGEPVVYVERGGRGVLRLDRARRAPTLAAAMAALAEAVANGHASQARDREARRRAGDRLRPRGGPARRRLQPRPAQADALRPLTLSERGRARSGCRGALRRIRRCPERHSRAFSKAGG